MLDINNLSLSKLASLYNECAVKLDKKPINKFPTRETALRRVKEILELMPKEPQPKVKEISRNGKMLGFTKDYPTTSKIKPLSHKNSIRSLLYPKLLAGATMEDLEEIFILKDKERGAKSRGDWRIRAYKTIRRFHFKYGYGIKITDKTVTIYNG